MDELITDTKTEEICEKADNTEQENEDVSESSCKENQDEKSQNSIILNWAQKAFKFLIKNISVSVTVVTAGVTALSFFFNQFFIRQCQSYYGVSLDCFKSQDYLTRWTAIIIILFLLLLSFGLFRILEKILNSKYPKVLKIIFESAMLFFTNIVMLTVVVTYSSYSVVTNTIIIFIANYIIFIILALLIMSVLFTLFIDFIVLHKNKKVKSSLFAIVLSMAFVFQLLYFGVFIWTYGSPNPENIKTYIVATEMVQQNDENQKEYKKYIIVGEYNGDFVCMNIESAMNFEDEEIRIDSDESLKNSTITVKKSEFEIKSANEFDIFNSYHINGINFIE